MSKLSDEQILDILGKHQSISKMMVIDAILRRMLILKWKIPTYNVKIYVYFYLEEVEGHRALLDTCEDVFPPHGVAMDLEMSSYVARHSSPTERARNWPLISIQPKSLRDSSHHLSLEGQGTITSLIRNIATKLAPPTELSETG
jgi:hypothetical protein